jgi:preprotein translocase subunit SecB
LRGRDKLKQYEVNIVARLNTTLLVNAEDEEQACLIAEQEFGGTFSVYNRDIEEHESFTEIIGYEPEEIK